MPVYNYNAIDPETRKSIAGQIEAMDHRHAKELIRNLGQIPTELNEHHEALTFGKVVQAVPIVNAIALPSSKDRFIFTEQIHTLLESGVPLVDGLYMMESHSSNKVMGNAVKKIREDVIAGDSFSNALRQFPEIFDALYLNLIRAGETSGQLSEITKRLAELIDAQMEIDSKIRGAMIMPIITTLVVTVVTLGVVVFLVPQFEPLFANAGNSLPLPTVLLIGISNFLLNFWWAGLAGLAGLAFWFNAFCKSPAGKPIVDQWLLNVPIIGDVVLKSSSSSFILTLATLQASGVPLTDGISVAADTVNNHILQEHLKFVKEKILAGASLAKPLAETDAFPPIVIKMITIGEETGSLESMLKKASVQLNREVDEAVKAMTEMIQPLLTVVIGGVLTFVLLGLYLPIFQMSQQFGH